jgi:hypothetical protein
MATPVAAAKGGQFVLHAKALHGNPYDGHTLGPVIADLEIMPALLPKARRQKNGKHDAFSSSHGSLFIPF